MKQIETMMQRHSIYDVNYDSFNIRKVEPVNMLIGFGKTETKVLVDSGSMSTLQSLKLVIDR